MIPKESGKDKANKGRMAWEIYEIRGNRILIMGIYGPANGGEDKKKMHNSMKKKSLKYWTQKGMIKS